MNRQPIRVLQVLGLMDRGGAEAMVMNLYRHIDREKVQFDFLVHTQKHAEYDDEIESLGGKIYRVQRFRGYNAVAYYKECYLFFDKHPEFKVVHGHIGSTAALYLFAAKRHGCYTIAHSHSASTVTDIKSFVYQICAYPTRYIAEKLLGCSTEAGIARYGKRAVLSDKYSNFRNAIQVSQYRYCVNTRNRIRKELGIPESAVVIGTVGRLTEAKNPPMLFEIFKKIVENYENSICLWIGTGEMEQEYREKIRGEGLENHIRMLGVRSDVADILQSFDCFLFPSLFEGLPVSVIEAQTSALPCLLSDVISREVEITDLISWMSLSKTADEWARKCMELAELGMKKRDDSIVKQIVEAGYDIDDTSRKLQNLYLSHA